MKILTFRLVQFAVAALFITVLFRYALHISIGAGNWVGNSLCSIVYFVLMFFIGWYFGKKDYADNGIHDIGFRFHITTYIVCIGLGFLLYYVGWNTETPGSMAITALSWGIGLLVHFILFLMEQKRTIKGYAKDEIFE